MTTLKHTPTPWVEGIDPTSIWAGEERIARFAYAEDAEITRRAVNSHAKLASIAAHLAMIVERTRTDADGNVVGMIDGAALLANARALLAEVA